MPLIGEIHTESDGTYGARRITRALGRKGVDVARCTVERLMTELGIELRVADMTYVRTWSGWRI
ncbi:IS3 family transposase [Streptomyces niveiscabiei]|uniref:IS3 family transposase n=1 Tax=Streptomyces niveiscabiei TaxID=164115 RepID=UPI0029B853E5|nr:IS3 family transposase [Streptomyces niveiscabiei]MDX3388208.1 IS3 family transposase [Streptomyces niveiscabiei]